MYKVFLAFTLALAPEPGTLAMDVVVSSPDFVAGSPIPIANTCDGANVSPALSWTTLPGSTRSIAVVMEDQVRLTHWILTDVDASTHTLSSATTVGRPVTNDLGRVRYDGPCPPAGSVRHYVFIVYGLDTTLDLDSAAKRSDFDLAANGHVVAQGQLLTSYQH